MIYTDFNIFFSDDPSNDEKELHDFAQSVGIDKGFHYNTNGRRYYLIKRSRGIMKQLLFRKAMVISKQTARNYLTSGTLNVIIRTNYEMYKMDRFFEGLFLEVADHYDIPVNKKTLRVSVDVHYIRCKGFFEDGEVTFTASTQHPEGLIELNRNKTIDILETPEFIKKKLKDNAKPASLALNRYKVK